MIPHVPTFASILEQETAPIPSHSWAVKIVKVQHQDNSPVIQEIVQVMSFPVPLFVPTEASNPIGVGCYELKDYPGDDIVNIDRDEVETIPNCQRLCQERDDCKFFTVTTAHCWLKHGRNHPGTDSIVHLSGPKFCPSKRYITG